MTTTTFIEFDGDGSNKNFAYTFPTYKISEVKVAVSGVIVDNWTIPAGWAASGSNTITFDNTTGTTNTTVCESSGAPKDGTKNVRIFRDTDIDSAKYTFNAGSSIKADELNTNHEQLRRALQEEQYNTINTYDIKDGAITSAKIEDNAITSAKIKDGEIVNADISSTAEIQVSKLKDGTARQVIQTAANGSDVEWTSNVDIPGTLDVTGNTKLDANLDVTGTLDVNSSVTIAGVTGIDGNFDINTNKFTVNATSGDTTIAGTLGVTGQITGNVTGNLTGNVTGNVSGSAGSVTGNAATATALQNARTIGGVSFDGTANINLPGVNTQGDQNTSGNAATATRWANSRTVASNGDVVWNSGAFDGSVNVTAAATIQDDAVTYAKMQNVSATNKVLGRISSGAGVVEELSAANIKTIYESNSNTNAYIDTHNTLVGGITSTASEINKLDGFTGDKDDLNIVTGMTKTVSTDTFPTTSDTAYPTAKAVNAHVVSLINDVGGFVPIANEVSFPNANPDPDDGAGTIVSIADAGGVVVNGSGVSTTGRTLGGATVTINGIDSSLYNTTIAAGKGMLVQTTSTLNTYTYHRLTLDEGGVASAQTLVSDFNERYRTGDNDPGSSNDEGDLFFNKISNTMKVYDGSDWKEVTSAGDFKYLYLCPTGGSGAPSFPGATYDLREGSNSGTGASVTKAAQLIVSVNGVIQKANTGTSAPSEGFALVDSNTIIFGTNLTATDSVFIVQIGSAVALNTPAADSVVAASIDDGAILNVAINTNADIAGSKLADDSIAEVKLDIHNAPSGTDKFLAYTSNGMEWAVPSTISFANDANNRVVTGTGSGLNGEANLTFDGNNLKVTAGSEGVSATLQLIADEGDDAADNWRIMSAASDNALVFSSSETTERLRIDSSGNVGIGVSPSKKLHIKGTDVALRLESTAATGRIGMEFYDTSAQKGFFGYPSSGNDHMAIQQNEAADLYFYVNGAERTRINSSGQVLIGTTTEGDAAADNLTIADSGTCGITIRSADTNTGNIYFSDATSGTGEFAGAIEYSHNGDTLRLHTNSNERVRIESGGNVKINDGDLVIGTAGHGIDFSITSDGTGGGTTPGSEILDDYEEGTWTPTLNTGDFGVTSYSTRNGTYTKIGRAVHIRMYIMLSDKGSNSGNLKLWGLPFTSAASPAYTSLAVWSTSMEVPGARSVIAYVNPGSIWCAIQRYNDSSGDANWCTEAHLNNNSEIQLSGTYYV